MKVKDSDKKLIFEREEKLKYAQRILKKEFVGLDKIIDEVCSNIEPWFLFPQSQIRPTIICLFGMTGVGKTSLIKRLFELIDKSDYFYKFDIGDYASDKNSLRYEFSEKLRKKQDEPVAIAFDEFQLGRTLDEHGVEIDRPNLRAVWDLLDSGKFDIFQDSYYGSQIYKLTLKLEKCIKDGMTAEKGIVTNKIETHKAIFKDEDEDEDEELRPKNKRVKKNKKERLFILKSWFWNIKHVWDERFFSTSELEEYLQTLNEKETLVFLRETMNEAFKPTEHDFSNSLIFVVGNIDEAYYMTKSIDPDADADRFYQHSLKITLPEIKQALRTRFRSEQIARLGNNHVIYPSFNSRAYKKLISQELEKIHDKIRKKYDLEIVFAQSTHDIIYKEGVFPTQGARPIFTTMNSLIESYVSKLIVDILKSEKDITLVKWNFKRNKFNVELFSNTKLIEIKKYPITLKVENLRKSSNDEKQAHTAVHEAGHAITAIVAMRLLPTEIVSKTASTAEGFCAVELPDMWTRESLENDIIVSLGGLVAEMYIFGDNNLSNGATSDLNRVTETAMKMVKEYGMGFEPISVNHKSVNVNESHYTSGVERYEEEALRIVKNAKDKAINILKENKLLFLQISDYLSKNSRMNQAKIEKMVLKYDERLISNLKTKKNYYNFKEIIDIKLKEEEKKHKPTDPIEIASRLPLSKLGKK